MLVLCYQLLMLNGESFSLWRSEFVTDLRAICGHCLCHRVGESITFWKWQAFVRLPPTIVTEKSSAVLAILFWCFMVCYCCDRKTQGAGCNVSIPCVYLLVAFHLIFQEREESGNQGDISVVLVTKFHPMCSVSNTLYYYRVLINQLIKKYSCKTHCAVTLTQT